MTHSAASAAPLRCRCEIPTAFAFRHSLWMTPALLGLGALSWVSFVYLAARMTTPRTVALAAGLTVAGLITGFWPAADIDTRGVLLVFTWAAAVVSAFIVNPAYHRHRWVRDGRCRCGSASLQGRGDPSGVQPATGGAGHPHAPYAPHARPQVDMPVIQDVIDRNPTPRGPERGRRP